MAASRLNESQKQELVARYRQGETSNQLAAAYGCSPNTVSRAVKAAIGAAEYDKLKQQRSRGGPGPAASVSSTGPSSAPPAVVSLVADPDSDPDPVTEVDEESETVAAEAVLPIEDADDFGDDDGDELTDTDDEAGDDAELSGPSEGLAGVISQEPVQALPLLAASLPESLYMLVDKTVELQARPLSEFSELGVIPADEEQRQALQLFANPRQAKRQCGRSQRVIKMPDPAVLVRQASYLQVKGITRLVVEGTLYALPGC